MSKKWIIVITVVVLILGAGGTYYFFHYNQQEAITSQTTETTETSETSEENDDSSSKLKKEMNLSKSPKEDEESVDNDKADDVEEDDSEILYTYQRTRRNPFSEYAYKEKNTVDNKEEENELTLSEVKEDMPFNVTGTVGYNKKWLATIETESGTNIVSENQEIEDYRILNIKEEQVEIAFKSFTFKIEIGSGSGVSQ